MRRIFVAGAVVFVVALGLLAWRGYQPLVERLGREAIAQLQEEMGARLGATVEVKDVSVRWDWGFPVLELGPTRIIEKKTAQEVIHWERSDVVLDLVATLRAKHAKLSGVRIHGLSLRVKETKPGEWNIAGITPSQSQGSDPFDWKKWVDGVWGFELEDAHVEVIPLSGKNAKKSGTVRIQEARLALQPANAAVEFQTEWKVKRFRFPNLWKGEYQELSWLIQGRVDSKKWTIESAEGNLGPIALKLKGEYSPQGDGWSLALELKKGLTTQDMLEHFPRGVLPKGAEAYLRESLLGGRFDRLKATLAQKPNHRNDFSFTVSSDFAQAKLHYLKDWPELEEASGHLEMNERHLAIDLAQGFAKESALSGKIAAEEWMSEKSGKWNFDLNINAEPGDVESFLKEGPFREKTELLTKWLHPESKVAMKVVATSQADAASGKIEISSSDWRLEKLAEFSPKQASAVIEFSPDRFDVSSIRGFTDQEPFEAQASFKKTDEQKASAWIWTAKSFLRTQRLASLLPGWPIADLINGKIPVESKGTWKDGFTLEATTTLKGVEVSLPPPLNKERTTDQLLRLKISGNDQGEWSDIEVTWNDETAIQTLVGKAKRAENLSKLDLQGKLSDLVIEQWQSAWREWNKRIDRAIPPVGDDSQNVWEISGKLDIARALWRDLRMEALALSWNFGSKSSRVEWRSRELTGVAQWKNPLRDNELNLQLAHLRFPEFPGKSAWVENEGIVSDPWDLAQWPSIFLNINEIRIADKNYGALRGKIRQTGEAIEIESMALSGGEIQARILVGKSDYKRSRLSKIEMKLQSQDVLLPLKFKTLESTELQRAKFHFKAAWPGGPDAFSWSKLSGSFTGSIGMGILRGVNSTGARIINLLSSSQGDMRQKILRFRRAYVDLRFEDGTLITEQTKGLFGNVFARLSGKIIIPEEKVSLLLRHVPGVETVPDPEFEPFYPDPEHLLSSSKRIEGQWSDPSVGL